MTTPAHGSASPQAAAPYILPASFAQERLWFFTQLVPDVAVYNIGCPISLAALGPPADAGRLEEAFARVVSRHETLRTHLAMRDGSLVQVVHPDLAINVAHTDLSDLPSGQAAARAMEITRQDAATPISLDQAPLWRARMIRLSATDSLFLVVVHHAIFDAQSTFNFASELHQVYRGLVGHTAPELPPLPIQYGDFAAWQRARLADGELDNQLAYWKQKLADRPDPMRLPSPLPASAQTGSARYRGGDVGFEFTEQVGAGTAQLARACRTTPFVVLLSAFAALLSRLTGQSDIIVGSPVSGRVTPELAPLIGMFVNTLVLRIDCAGDPGFRDLIGRVRATVLEALEHQEFPYDRLVEALGPDRDADGSPLHQVVLNLLPLIPNAQVRNGTAKVDLLIDLADLPGGGYDGRLEYRADLLDDVAAQTFADRLGRLLAAALADPAAPIASLPIMDAAERRTALAAADSPGPARPAPQVPVTDLFAAQVATRPDALAVVDGAGRRLSYGELDRQADLLARHLVACAQAGTDAPVAILLETDGRLAVAALAVLKAGAPYLPLDQRHPADRMRYMIQDAGAVAIVTSAGLADRLPADAGLPVIDIAAIDTMACAADGLAPPAGPAHLDALAYVIYTSGSTGEPKGVAVTHRNLATYADELMPLLDTAPGRVFSMLQALTFDFSVTMFYGALMTGGTLHLVPRDNAADASWVAEHLRRDRVDYVKITPSHLLALQAGGQDPAALLPQRALILGGESSSWSWVKDLRKHRPGCAVLNHYGPTEATVGVLALPGSETPGDGVPVTPLGWPLSHSRVYVLGERLDLVPEGVTGEIYVGGAKVSRGYLHRPGMTADRYRPDPFTAGGRLYRTGDRARRLPGGAVDFAGRLDDQVKVRGYRVELGEVRRVLAADHQVADCVVTLAEQAGTQPQLVAYVVATREAVDFDALRENAAMHLPEFMIPSIFVRLDAMPLAAHGKADKSRLPAPSSVPDADLGGDGSAQAQSAKDTAAAPRGTTEELVASFFGLLLGRQNIGRDDGFFATGGHSLLAIQLVTRLRTAFGVGIPLRAVFENPTVAGIGATVQAQQGKRRAQLPPVTPVPRDRPLAASYGQRRLWFLDRFEAQPSGEPIYNTNICLRIAGPLDASALRRALELIIDRHEVLRTRFISDGDELIQVIAAHVELPFHELVLPEAGQPAAGELRVRAALEQAAAVGFDLAADPAVRVMLVRCGADQRLLITLHHLVNDAWSAVLLTRELGELYASLRSGRAADLPELSVQYADYASWQRALVTGELRDTQLAYWRKQLAGLPDRLELPADRPRPARRGYSGAHVPFAVPVGVADKLRALGADANASLFMTLLAAFFALLARYTGQHDLAIGTPAANRPRPELEPLIGFFLNTLVLRTDCSGDPSFRALIGRVRTTTLDAFANSDVPFEALVEDLRPRRDLGGTPFVQVLFTLEDAERPVVVSDEIELRWQPFGTDTAKFDITVYLWRQRDALTGSVEYRTDLFDPPTMERFAEHYTTLLTAAAVSPDLPLSALPLLSADDVGRVAGWNSTGVSFPGPVTVPALLAAQAAATPGLPALITGAGTVDYAEFRTAVNQLAHHLREAGAGPDDVVAVLAGRGAGLVTAIHAIHAAGAAYLPLDPDNPPARLAYMCADARARLLVTDHAHATAAGIAGGSPPGTGTAAWDLTVIETDTDAALIAARPDAAPPLAIHPDQLAYVIYTSGSTGHPKGVAITHRALANRLHWMQQAFPLTPADRVAHKTPFGFDVSVWELCWPLTAGAAMVIADPGGHRDTGYLTRLFAAASITTAHFVPSMLEAFLDEDHPAGQLATRLPRLRQVFCSGEALPPALADRFRALLPRTELHNLYGPTETAIDVTWHHCQPGETPLPIGAPIANTRASTLDPAGQQTPVGVPGELCISGTQLARGYLHHPALTAQAFTPDPNGPPGTRQYHTGDLARWLPAGQLDYLGRIDHQIKIRGMRVELGEIEATLATAPGIKTAVVTATTDHTGTQLTAYLIPADPASPPDPQQLHTHLSATLPPHMTPTTYQTLDHLPTTPNGKLDRTALPKPTAGSADAGFTEAADEAERAVAAVWQQVLGKDRIGAHDDFFALGGDSIRTLKVISRLRDAGYLAELEQIFIYPTVRGLAAAMAPLTVAAAEPGEDGQAEPFGLLIRATADGVRAMFPTAQDAYPLADLQAGMVFHNLYADGLPTYHDVFTIGVESRYDLAALRAAVAETSARHSILRTSFHLDEFDEPVQVVHQAGTVPVTEADLGPMADGDLAGAIARFQDEEKVRPFALTTAPLIRIFAHRLGDGTFALTLSFHHAILDGWSVATLTTELLRRYAAHLAGRPAEPADTLPISYRDFVASELAATRAQDHSAFWRNVMLDAPATALPRLPGLGQGGAGQGGAGHGRAGQGGARQSTHQAVVAGLEPHLIASLERAARSASVPLRTVLLAAHLRVLALLGGDPDVVTGVVTHGRPAHESGDRLLGLFLNTMPLRVRTARPSWNELITAVFEAEVAALPHRMYPLRQIQRATGRSPAFEVLFDYRDFHVYGELPDDDQLRITSYRFFEQTNLPFAANFIRSPADGTLAMQLKFDAEQFSPDQLAGVRQMYLLALTAVAADPAADPRPTAPYLSTEIARIRQWNATGRRYPATTLPGLVRAQAARTPKALAVATTSGALDYAEFSGRVNRLARHLGARGAGLGDVVGVCLERGTDLLVAVHAIQAAGAAYLPLEVDYPPDRLAFMTADAGASLVITTSALADRIAGAKPVCLDIEATAIAARSATNAEVTIPPQALAYVIYTSGSTGVPKGVGVSHDAIANRLQWMAETFPLGPADRVLHKTPFGFDVSVWELFWPLMTGAAVVMADPGGHRVPGHLARLVADHQVTVAHFVPSMLDAMLDTLPVAVLGRQADPQDLPGWHASLRRIFCSGEALGAALAARFHALLPGVELHNLYGPTEAAVDVTWHHCRPGETVIPIGRGVANTRIEILGADGERAPVGTPGELYIGGIQLARGYLGRPGLTADRFVPDPDGRGSRLYRSGDLARWLPGGEVEYLGRLDHQVKIRGFRIELGEIESALAAEAEVHAAIVLARPDATGTPRLVGYVVYAPDATADGPALIERLRRRLPEHMLPTALVPLTELPLTRSGKVDRAALPDPDPRPSIPYRAPAAGAESAIAAVWEEVLGIEAVGADDDFFALGGDSIRSLKVVARLRAQGYGLSIADLFTGPTVRALAGVLELAKQDADPSPRSTAFGLITEADMALLRQQFGGGPQ